MPGLRDRQGRLELLRASGRPAPPGVPCPLADGFLPALTLCAAFGDQEDGLELSHCLWMLQAVGGHIRSRGGN